ncbi:MAG: ABC transporter ATP-binding protein [Roseburia sp.]|nr:ABC transporter ATP-binding protein [Roseburia sp.]MCM1431015.1 ABC transporter ATP-binding protein [Muribaculaceae bacterium]
MKTVLSAENICRSFGKQTVLRGVSLTIREQSLVILKGRSGSGKTTLLNILGGLDRPSGGSVTFLGEKLGKMSDTKRDALRKKRMGFVFQSVALVPVMSAYENVEFALRLAGYTGDRKARIFELMERVGLAGRLNHMALELSGGEQQRVAIARAIAHHPAVLFADEPTGALDTASGLAVMELFRELVEKEGAAIVMTTHDRNLMEFSDVTYEMADGGIV